ncbi:hypothetical protein F442_04347 [Phytophthora nicotianae P10297]|uniref:Uncharacterized protein n=2 Tax=Phytophthora nicotianae P10297 TaxID=1317064 RepID=W2ZW08_PHYNI|nr:hypothetical protein F442_04347 [Phytophthora nicotianae P10297]
MSPGFTTIDAPYYQTSMQGDTPVASPSASEVVLSGDALASIEDMGVVDKCSNSGSSPPIEASAVSDTTISSSDRFSSCSSSDSSSDALDDDYGAHLLSSSDDDDLDDDDDSTEGDEEQDAQPGIVNHFLIKPMPSRLQVCPLDDLAVEEEKRRRRSRRNLKNKTNGKNAPLNGASRDAESLPSTPSPIMGRTRRSGSSPTLCTRDSTTPVTRNRPSSARERRHTSASPDAAVRPSNGSRLAPTVPLLRKDSAAIRRQYWSQLGFSLSRSDLEKSTGRKKERREGLKVRLNDADSERERGAKSFFQFITSWYAPITAVSGEEKSSRKGKGSKPSARQLRSSLSRTSASSSSLDVHTPKKGVRFNEEAELFYIPLHRDYSKRQRDCMWPTRAEFVAMVERNLDAVYDEMEREYEAQLENEYLENEGMAREEARQRTVEAQQRKADEAQAAAESRRSVSPPLSRSSSTMSTVPSLTLSQKQVLVSPRARSSHDLRFKYLKHLGIDS